MRKLYQILYNVGRLTDAPGGGRFLSRGDTLAVELFPFLGDTLAVGFPFLGDTLAWAGLRGGKALGVTKPAFPPRAPPFRARRCSALWYGVVYWQIPVCCCIDGVRLSRFFCSAGRKAVCTADLFLVVVILLTLICSCLLFYYWH